MLQPAGAMNGLPVVVVRGVSAVSVSDRAAGGGGDSGLPVERSAVGEVAAGDWLRSATSDGLGADEQPAMKSMTINVRMITHTPVIRGVRSIRLRVWREHQV
jgi:hypothetical protein